MDEDRWQAYVPIATSTWRAAAKLWATLRNAGTVTAAPNALDGDVLIAAQALAEGASVMTPNIRHFEAIVPALAWRDVPLLEEPPPEQGAERMAPPYHSHP